MSKFGYIYKSTNLLNGKIYVGQRIGKVKLSYYGSGTTIKKALIKNGTINFSCEVIDYADNIDELNCKEILWISKLSSTNRNIGYNIELGGKNSSMSSSTKEKLSTAHKGKKLSKEHIENISKASSRRTHTKETKKKISESATGRKLSQETKIKVGLASKNRPSGKKGTKLSDETKKLISKSSKGRWLGREHSEETKLKMSQSRKEYWDKKLNRV